MINPLLKDILITIGVGIPFAIIVLRLLFRKSIIFTIGTMWAANIFLIVVNTKLTEQYKDAYPQYISLPTGIIITSVFIYLLYKYIKKPLNDSFKNVELLTAGNLNVEIDDKQMHRNDELGMLAKSLSKLSITLKNSIIGIQSISQQINSASAQLRATSEDLSSGTSSEAASIEEISSSMEEMVVSINNNSENSGRTNKIAREANSSVSEGNQSAQVAITALKEIAEKIKIIDDIAFQTNILSLNASVEAARAGEHGRGFAVVAGEVRSLAERSKKEANEIAEMSKHATLISEQAGEKLNSSIPLMVSTAELISSITAASSEQSMSAEQINSAINEINLNIQSNATTAEEMSASAEELEKYAAELKENIAFFNTQNENINNKGNTGGNNEKKTGSSLKQLFFRNAG
jgi:methyl-accepting chemotaxis protein